MNNKKVLAFDVDGCLVVTKQPMTDKMAQTIAQLLEHYDIMAISGSPWSLFEENIVRKIEPLARDKLHKLHLMPTCGTTYYQYGNSEWNQLYCEDLTKEDIAKIDRILEQKARKLGYWVDNPAGVIIEDRGSQVTYSALGQMATPDDKHAWDPDHSKKQLLYDEVVDLLSEFDVKVGGTTSIDVTKPGVDKAYGMAKFIEINGFTKDDVVYFGDMLHETGNDYPIRAMGVNAVEVRNPDHTHELIIDFLNR